MKMNLNRQFTCGASFLLITRRSPGRGAMNQMKLKIHSNSHLMNPPFLRSKRPKRRARQRKSRLQTFCLKSKTKEALLRVFNTWWTRSVKSSVIWCPGAISKSKKSRRVLQLKLPESKFKPSLRQASLGTILTSLPPKIHSLRLARNQWLGSMFGSVPVKFMVISLRLLTMKSIPTTSTRENSEIATSWQQWAPVPKNQSASETESWSKKWMTQASILSQCLSMESLHPWS